MSKKHYSEIFDIPLLNWEKCLEGRYEFMRREKVNKFDKSDVEQFVLLFDKYLKRRGLSDEQIKYFEKQKIYLEFTIQYLRTGNQMLLNHLAISEIEMNEIDPRRHKGVSIGQTIVTLSKWMKSWIDKKAITLEDYINLLTEFEKDIKNKQNG